METRNLTIYRQADRKTGRQKERQTALVYYAIQLNMLKIHLIKNAYGRANLLGVF